MPKNVERDYTIIGRVLDETTIESCEIVIHKASISYPKDGNIEVLVYDDESGNDKGDVGIEVLSTRMVDANGGEVLEED